MDSIAVYFLLGVAIAVSGVVLLLVLGMNSRRSRH